MMKTKRKARAAVAAVVATRRAKIAVQVTVMTASEINIKLI